LAVIVEQSKGKEYLNKLEIKIKPFMGLYFCSAKHLLQRGGAQMRGGAVTIRQAYSGVSAASVIIFIKSDEN